MPNKDTRACREEMSRRARGFLDNDQRVIDFMDRLRTFTPEKPVASRLIEASLNLTGPELRAVVSELRVRDYEIGSNGSGYYWARNADELQQTIAHMEGRLTKMGRVLHALKRTQARLRCGASHQGRLL